MNARLIPVLLLKDGGLVKSVRFKNHRYVGDPINAIRIFNDKGVDELVFLDTTATALGTGPKFSLLRDLAGECFMPFAYGGGISQVEQGLQLVRLGVEKVILNTAAGNNPRIVQEMATKLGSQSVVVCVDVARSWLGKYEVKTGCGQKRISSDPVEYCRAMERLGAGEIILQSIDRDGTRQGYDLGLIESVAQAVSIPVVACGGAGQLSHAGEAIRAGASAAAAGSIFVFYGKHQAVLVNYPTPEEIESNLRIAS